MKELRKHCEFRCAAMRFCYSPSLAGGSYTNPSRHRYGHGARYKKASRPTRPCGRPRMNPSLDDGNPPRPFRHLRVAEHCTPDQISSQAPVHSVLVQKSVTTITNRAGRLSVWMLGETSPRWQEGGRKKLALSLPAGPMWGTAAPAIPPGACLPALHPARSTDAGRAAGTLPIPHPDCV